MTDPTPTCPTCGSPMPAGIKECPVCSVASSPSSVEESAKAAGGRSRRGGSREVRGRVSGPSPSLKARIEKLASWREKAKGLRVLVPALPEWADGQSFSQAEEERWEEGVRGLERAAFKEISSALDSWTKDAAGRLNRLEAYGLPSPTERRSLDEMARSVKAGDLDRGLELFQKVSTVVVMKERNLEDAIDSVEAIKVLSTDMEAVGLPLPWGDASAGSRLDNELRTGKVAEAFKEATELRQKAATVLSQDLPGRVNEQAGRVAEEKAKGQDISEEASLLARAARSLRQGRPEDALRELVRYQSRRTLDPFAMVEQQLKGGN